MRNIFKRFLMFPFIGILTCSFGNPPPKPGPQGNTPMTFFPLQCPLYNSKIFCNPHDANHVLRISKRDPNGENLEFDRMVQRIDITSYDCLIQSVARENIREGLEWCPGNFSLMYSFPLSGGYGKKEYVRLTPENFARYKNALMQRGAHLAWIPRNWVPGNANCQ